MHKSPQSASGNFPRHGNAQELCAQIASHHALEHPESFAGSLSAKNTKILEFAGSLRTSNVRRLGLPSSRIKALSSHTAPTPLASPAEGINFRKLDNHQSMRHRKDSFAIQLPKSTLRHLGRNYIFGCRLQDRVCAWSPSLRFCDVFSSGGGGRAGPLCKVGIGDGLRDFEQPFMPSCLQCCSFHNLL